MLKNHNPIHAGIFGVEGLSLSRDEIDFFTDLNPLGFILFARNIDTPEQVLALTNNLRDITGRKHTPILIDQEGGRVQRMTSPHWNKYSSARPFGTLYETNPEQATQDTLANAQSIAMDLTAVGINVDCLPLLDVPISGADKIIGDRAFSTDKDIVSVLGAVQANGLLSKGVLPVIKHIPGHGRAMVDSHINLPVVSNSLEELWESDFIPFVKNNSYPMAMTAHVIFEAIDAENPISCSKKGIDFLRDEIGYDGLIMCDDLSMHALKGSLADRANTCMDAGCDVVLHCSGVMVEMQCVASVLKPLSGDSMERWERAESLISE